MKNMSQTLYYQNELDAIKKSNRFRTRKLYNPTLIDLASNDYLGLGNKEKLFKKAYQLLTKEASFSPKSSLLVNGYHKIHKKFEEILAKENNFEQGIIIGKWFFSEYLTY